MGVEPFGRGQPSCRGRPRRPARTAMTSSLALVTGMAATTARLRARCCCAGRQAVGVVGHLGPPGQHVFARDSHASPTAPRPASTPGSGSAGPRTRAAATRAARRTGRGGTRRRPAGPRSGASSRPSTSDASTSRVAATTWSTFTGADLGATPPARWTPPARSSQGQLEAGGRAHLGVRSRGRTTPRTTRPLPKISRPRA